ncbi:MAG: phosphotransferase [Terriglobales bacterium]
MHELLLDLVRDARVPPLLARIPLDDGGLVAAFDPGARRDDAPRWIAKLAYGPVGCQRLRAEARALARLEAVADFLRAPRLVGWREAGEGERLNACLVQSGLSGRRLQCRWPGRQSWRPLPPELGWVSGWLERLQAADLRVGIISPRPSLGELMVEAAISAQQWMRGAPELAPLVRPLLGVVEASPSGLDQPAVAAHGDFWTGNCLVRAPGQIAVIDWSGLQPGSALEDILTFTSRLVCGPEHARWEMVERWQRIWFVPGAGREFLRAWARAVGYSDCLARYSFYLFLLRRLGWELGFALQTRNRQERSDARAQWTCAVEWLALHRFPDPFTPFPLPD